MYRIKLPELRKLIIEKNLRINKVTTRANKAIDGLLKIYKNTRQYAYTMPDTIAADWWMTYIHGETEIIPLSLAVREEKVEILNIILNDKTAMKIADKLKEKYDWDVKKDIMRTIRNWTEDAEPPLKPEELAQLKKDVANFTRLIEKRLEFSSDVNFTDYWEQQNMVSKTIAEELKIEEDTAAYEAMVDIIANLMAKLLKRSYHTNALDL